MANIQDEAKSFKINLAGPSEGLASILFLWFMNFTTGVESIWNPVTGWSNPTEAVEGDSAGILIMVQNDGLGTDTIWAGFSSGQVIPNEPTFVEWVLEVGTNSGFWWTFTIPSSEVSIDLTAGHVED